MKNRPESQIVHRTPFSSTGLNLAGLIVLLVFSHIGCGIKGPPIPARMPPLPAAADLSYRLDGVAATLAWRLPERLTRRQAGGANFVVYRSRDDLSKPICGSCPLVFEKAAVVPYVDSGDNRYATTMALDPGYRYVFKVRLEANGQVGAEAEPIRFEVPVEGPSAQGETP